MIFGRVGAFVAIGEKDSFYELDRFGSGIIGTKPQGATQSVDTDNAADPNEYWWWGGRFSSDECQP